jgi:hypothetical protein
MSEPPFTPFDHGQAAAAPADRYAPFRLDVTGMAETATFPDTPLERARAGARSLRQTAALARAFADAGREIDLTGLDGQIGFVCAKTLDLPPAEGRLMAGELQALLAEIEQLADTMRLSALSS